MIYNSIYTSLPNTYGEISNKLNLLFCFITFLAITRLEVETVPPDLVFHFQDAVFTYSTKKFTEEGSAILFSFPQICLFGGSMFQIFDNILCGKIPSSPPSIERGRVVEIPTQLTVLLQFTNCNLPDSDLEPSLH